MKIGSIAHSTRRAFLGTSIAAVAGVGSTPTVAVTTEGMSMNLIDKLVAIEGIKATKAQYLHGVDTKNDDLWRSVFADNVELDMRGAVTDPDTGRNFVPAVEKILYAKDLAGLKISEMLAGVQSVHHVSVPIIEITSSTTGKAIWPLVDRLKFRAGNPYKEIIGYGYYHDTYEFVGGSWKVTSSRLERTRLDFLPW